MDDQFSGDSSNPPSNPRVTPVWKNLSGLDDHHEIEIAEGVVLAIHRVSGGLTWQAMIFDQRTGEESPFLIFSLKSQEEGSAKREATRRTIDGLKRLVDAIQMIEVAA